MVKSKKHNVRDSDFKHTFCKRLETWMLWNILYGWQRKLRDRTVKVSLKLGIGNLPQNGWILLCPCKCFRVFSIVFSFHPPDKEFYFSIQNFDHRAASWIEILLFDCCVYFINNFFLILSKYKSEFEKISEILGQKFINNFKALYRNKL